MGNGKDIWHRIDGELGAKKVSESVKAETLYATGYK